MNKDQGIFLLEIDITVIVFMNNYFKANIKGI